MARQQILTCGHCAHTAAAHKFLSHNGNGRATQCPRCRTTVTINGALQNGSTRNWITVTLRPPNTPYSPPLQEAQ
jgi:hypothetical protein